MFELFLLVNNAAVNIWVHVSSGVWARTDLGSTPRLRLAGWKVEGGGGEPAPLQVSQMWPAALQSHPTPPHCSVRSSQPPCPDIMREKWFLTMILICISLLASEVEHLWYLGFLFYRLFLCALGQFFCWVFIFYLLILPFPRLFSFLCLYCYFSSKPPAELNGSFPCRQTCSWSYLFTFAWRYL